MSFPLAWSPGATLGVALVVLAVLAAAAVAAAVARRRGPYGTGVLSAETRRRDKPHPSLESPRQEPVGRAVERAAVLERTGGGVAPLHTGPPTRAIPPDAETLRVTRRQFFNRGIIALFGLGLSAFGSAILAFLWPQLAGGFGAKIRVGKLDDVLGEIRDTREPKYVAEGRFYVNPYPRGAVGKAERAYDGAVLAGMKEGVVALYQKCPHLGCRVPWCKTSQWFECPCHGSQYNRVGEKKGGPAPRGMDRFGVDTSGGQLTVDTGTLVLGPPIGTNTTGQEAEGPHCIGSVEE